MTKYQIADELRKKILSYATIRLTDKPRTSCEALMEALEPIIQEIAEIKSHSSTYRITGYERHGGDPVPGCGPIDNVIYRDGYVYVTRDGKVYKAGVRESKWDIVE